MTFLTSSEPILAPLGLNLEALGLHLPPFGLSWGHLGSSLGCLGSTLGALVPLIVSILAPLGANCGNLDPQDPSPLAFLSEFQRFFHCFGLLFPSNLKESSLQSGPGGVRGAIELLN